MPTRADPPPPREASLHGRPIVEQARVDIGGERSPTAWLLIFAAVILVGLAVVKPWDASPGPTTAALPLRPPAAAPGPTAQPEPTPFDDGVAERCNRPIGWRVYTTAIWRDQRIRSFVAMEPLVFRAMEPLVGDAFGPAISGPLDARIPVVPIYGAEIQGLGFCSPILAESRPPTGLSAELWYIDAEGIAYRVQPRRIEPSRASSMGGLYGRWTEELRPDEAPIWPQGRYVFHLSDPDAGAYSVWFAIEVNPVR